MVRRICVRQKKTEKRIIIPELDRSCVIKLKRKWWISTKYLLSTHISRHTTDHQIGKLRNYEQSKCMYKWICECVAKALISLQICAHGKLTIKNLKLRTDFPIACNINKQKQKHNWFGYTKLIWNWELVNDILCG